MYYLTIIFYIIYSSVIIYYLNKVFKEIESIQESHKINNVKKARTHSVIKQSNYDNCFGGRINYNQYKNKDGLYEPVQPFKGIKLKKEV